VWGHWMRYLSERNQLIRYDERGCGLSQRDVSGITFDDWVTDLEAVVDHLELEQFNLLGMSQGGLVATEYAARHPERVDKLVLMGTTPFGSRVMPEHPNSQQFDALTDLVRIGWGMDNPAFRTTFTHLFIPEAEPKHIDWYADLAKRTATREVAEEIMQILATMDVREALKALAGHDIETLIMHADEDGMLPLLAGQLIAAELPKAQFVQLESKNHILLETEPAWARFTSVLDGFMHTAAGPLKAPDPGRFDGLTKRENEVLTLVASGQDNGQIAQGLYISEKTVRNHVTSILEKLGVNTRAKAIVLAKDMGY